MVSNLSNEELLFFHSTDRNLFTRLMRDLGHNSFVAHQVMAFWLWLEENGYESMSQEIQRRALPDNVVNALVNEALQILTLMERETLPNNVSNQQFPTTFGILQEQISIGTMHEARLSVTDGVARQLVEVCCRTFEAEEENLGQIDDVGGIVVPPNVNQVQPDADRRIEMQQRLRVILPDFPFALDGLHPGFGFRPPSQFFYRGMQPAPLRVRPNLPVVVPPPRLVPINPHQQSFLARPHFEVGGSSSNILQVRPHLEVGGLSNIEPVTPHFEVGGTSSIQPANPSFVPEVADPAIGNAESSPPEDRALFATFSKGYGVSKEELEEYLNGWFGGIVETIEMEQTEPGVQALYARVVLRSPENVDQVLEGSERTKFVIHGKHVCVKKFVVKQ